MARLIDANSILDDFLKRYTEMEKDGKLVFAACEIKQDFADMISNVPTVDAVPVVRCKDCVHHEDEEPGMVYCPAVIGGWVSNNFFCGDGEREKNERNN